MICLALVPLSSDFPPPDTLENIDRPITFRKGTCTCKSTYSITNFVSYNRLPSTSRSLIASIDSIIVPKAVKEALSHYRWSKVMLEEIHAFKNTTCGIWWIYPKG